jgi:hypothetical protein
VLAFVGKKTASRCACSAVCKRWNAFAAPYGGICLKPRLASFAGSGSAAAAADTTGSAAGAADDVSSASARAAAAAELKVKKLPKNRARKRA